MPQVSHRSVNLSFIYWFIQSSLNLLIHAFTDLFIDSFILSFPPVIPNCIIDFPLCLRIMKHVQVQILLGCFTLDLLQSFRVGKQTCITLFGCRSSYRVKIAGSINLSLCTDMGVCRMGLEKNCLPPYMYESVECRIQSTYEVCLMFSQLAYFTVGVCILCLWI